MGNKMWDQHADRNKRFQFSILGLLPITCLREEVIQLEQITKKKWGVEYLDIIPIEVLLNKRVFDSPNKRNKDPI